MPYQKRYRKRKQHKKKATSTLSKIDRALSTATKAFALGKLVYSLLNVELKKTDLAISTTANSITPYDGAFFNPVAQGASATERNGSQIEWKNYFVSGTVNKGTSAIAGPVKVRLVIAVMNDNEATSNGANLFTDCYSSSDPNSLRDLDHTDDWTVLRNMEFVLTDDKPMRNIKMHHKFPNNSLKYKYTRGSTSGAVTAIEDKCVYIGMTTDQVGTDVCDLKLNIRGTYIDN